MTNIKSGPHLYRSYPDSTQYIKTHIQSVSHMYSQCSVCNSLLQPMSSQYSSVLKPCYAFSNLYSPCSESTPSQQHKSRPNPISAAPLLPTSAQYTIYTSHFLSVHHPICPYTVSTPSLLSTCSQ